MKGIGAEDEGEAGVHWKDRGLRADSRRLLSVEPAIGCTVGRVAGSTHVTGGVPPLSF